MSEDTREWVWLVEFEEVPRAIFSSYKAAAAYTRQRRQENPELAITTTKIQSFLEPKEQS